MKSSTIWLLIYVALLILSLVLAYFLIVFSIFYFWGRHIDKLYPNDTLISILIYTFYVILSFVFLFSAFKIYKTLK